MAIISVTGGNGSGTLVPLPSNLSPAEQALIQAAINGAVTSGGSVVNFNAGTGVTDTVVSGSGNFTYEITQLSDTVSPLTGGTFVVPVGAATLIVQAGGTYNVTGTQSTTLAYFGADSNVDYTVVDPTAGTIIGGGGANTFNIDSDGTSAPVSENIYSAGNDTINATGVGQDTITAQDGANDLVNILSGTTTVDATGNSTVTVTFRQQAGANLTFINNSTTSQTVFSGAYTQVGGGSVFAPNSVTADGGAGGGYYVGGLAGNNSLIGGTGLATLQGGGSGDFLEVTGGDSVGPDGISGNVLFGGSGTETMIATSSTQDNTFNIGGQYTGKGFVFTEGLVSTEGSGNQFYYLGNSAGETIFGSTAATSNFYTVVGDSTSGGGQYFINNFTKADGSTIFLTGQATDSGTDTSIEYLGAGIGAYANSTVVQLTDGTSLTLVGVASSSVGSATSVGSDGGTVYNIFLK